MSSRRLFGALFSLALIAGCAADRLHRDGLAAIDRGDYETGIADLSQAMVPEPGDIASRLHYEARRDSAVQKLIGHADEARSARQFDAAAGYHRRVLKIDPNTDRD